MSAALLAALGLDKRDAPRLVQLMGAGGKTTAMYALAKALQAEGRRVVTTTTTRILPPDPSQSHALLMADELEGLEPALSLFGHATIAAERLGDGKLSGITTEQLEDLLARHPLWHVIAECDGSKGRSLKAHAPHEPVLADIDSLVVAVVGLDIIGAPLDEQHVHRAPLLAEHLGVPLSTTLDAPLVARAVGLYLERIPPAAERAVLLTKLAPEREAKARDLALALRALSGTPPRIIAVGEREVRPT